MRCLLLILLCVQITIPASAEDWACGYDFDGDGTTAQEGETATCEPVDGGTAHLCLLTAVECVEDPPALVCPLGDLLCGGGVCQQPTECVLEYSSNTSLPPTSRCPLTSSAFASPERCAAACVEEATCTVAEVTFSCPTAGEPCLQNAGVWECNGFSGVECVDLDTIPPVVAEDLDSDMLVDDGVRTEDGTCLDTLYIFSGRAMECHPSGVDTGFSDCCTGDEVFSDGAGSMVSAASSLKTIKTTFEAVQVAAETYYFATEVAGGTAAWGAEFAATEASNVFMGAFDPTTLAISIAIYLIMDYLMQGCEAEDLETAMLNDSGYCHYIGDYCVKKWSGVGCVQEAEVYCCFNSELARIVHEQGRAQLNTFSNWGDIKDPDCRGFTPAEFQSLDFSQIDLSEYFEGLARATSEEMNDRIESGVEAFYEGAH